MTAMRNYPNDGCKQAFECGKEYVLSGGTPKDLHIALTFCDNLAEEAFFLLGCAEEARDLEELVHAH